MTALRFVSSEWTSEETIPKRPVIHRHLATMSKAIIETRQAEKTKVDLRRSSREYTLGIVKKSYLSPAQLVLKATTSRAFSLSEVPEFRPNARAGGGGVRAASARGPGEKVRRGLAAGNGAAPSDREGKRGVRLHGSGARRYLQEIMQTFEKGRMG